jgi:gluconolactonase
MLHSVRTRPRYCNGAALIVLYVLIVMVAVLAVPAGGQEPYGTFVEVNPGFQDLFPSGTQVEKLAGGFQFLTEGPLWNSDGYLLFTDISANAIKKWSPEGGVTIFRRPSRQANGLTYDRQRRLIACEEESPPRLTRTESDGTITVLAERYEGRRITRPNDVVVRSDGSIYFTAPPATVYRVSPAGELTLLASDFSFANGLAFSADEKLLYIADSYPKGQIRVYDASPEGLLANGRVFASTKAGRPDQHLGPDGMKLDRNGNLYCASMGSGLWVFDPAGTLLGTITVGEDILNCGWGDADGKSLYITALRSLYRVRGTIEGIRP